MSSKKQPRSLHGNKAEQKKWEIIANALKIVVNGSFGKFGSRYSILYSPDLMLQVTITGQLCRLCAARAPGVGGCPRPETCIRR